MTDFSLVTGIVFMTYDQYVKGEVLKKNDPSALGKFESYLIEKLLQQGDGILRHSADFTAKQVNS